MSSGKKVSAEVVLKSSSDAKDEASDLVAGKLRESGIRIIDAGPRSISIQARQEDFERVFSCKLVARDDKKTGARSYGVIGGPALRPATAPVVPSDLKAYVASVEVQEPPIMF
jgi:hypothetical protein